MTDQPTTPSVMGAETEETMGVVATPTTQPETTTQPDPGMPVERTLKVIQAELIERGFPKEQVKGLQSKAVAQAVLDSMTKNPVSAGKVEVVKVATLDEKPDPREEKVIEKQYLSRRDIMRAKLEAQPQVPIFIPKADTEPAGIVKVVKVAGKNEYVHVGGSVEVFTLQGYQVIVPKGVQTNVPLQIFQLWSDSLRLTQQAGSQFSVNRIDPATGQPVANRL